MALKGQESKKVITQQILETFEGAFVSGKEIRIPFTEDGVPVQIKVSLTAAKDIIENPNGNLSSPSVSEVSKITVKDSKIVAKDEDFSFGDSITAPRKTTEPSQEEKETVRKLMEKLNTQFEEFSI
jgi:hypothetical protein